MMSDNSGQYAPAKTAKITERSPHRRQQLKTPAIDSHRSIRSLASRDRRTNVKADCSLYQTVNLYGTNQPPKDQ